MTALLLGLTPLHDGRIGAAPAHSRLQLADRVALICPCDLGPPESSPAPDLLEQAALRQHAILQAYAAQTTVMPVRFGAVFSSETAVCRFLQDPVRAAQHGALLARLDGCLEFGLVLTALAEVPAAPPVPAASSGRAFLARRADARTQRQKLTEDRQAMMHNLAEALGAHGTAQVRNSLRPGRLLDLSLLVPRAHAAALATNVGEAEVTARALGLELHLNGPWPPYSFSTLPEITHVT